MGKWTAPSGLNGVSGRWKELQNEAFEYAADSGMAADGNEDDQNDEAQRERKLENDAAIHKLLKMNIAGRCR